MRQEDTTAQQRTVGLRLDLNDRVIDESEDIEHRRQAGVPGCLDGLQRPLDGGGWMFNALGSKGSLYAPGMAGRLARWLLDGVEPELEVDFRVFRAQTLRDESR